MGCISITFFICINCTPGGTSGVLWQRFRNSGCVVFTGAEMRVPHVRGTEHVTHHTVCPAHSRFLGKGSSCYSF